MTKLVARVTYLLIAIPFLAPWAPNCWAQQYPISETEFDTIRQSAFQKGVTSSRRVEEVESFFSNGSLVRTEKYVWEYAVPNRTRGYHTTIKEGKSTVSEMIQIDNMIYQRVNNGVWEKEVAGGSGSGMGGSGSGPPSLSQTTREFVSLKGVSAILYSEFRVEKVSGKLMYTDSKVWIDTDERLVRKERSTGTLYPEIKDSYSETVYTYDPSIKIEAPIK